MIKYIKKDITTVQYGIIGHGCNSRGVMGAGVALAIKHKWSKAYTEYAAVCTQNKQPSGLLGTVHVVDVSEQPNLGTLFIANCFTQLTCGRSGVYASVDAVKEALANVIAFADFAGLPLYLPKIGCGLGGLIWHVDVLPVLVEIANENPEVEIIVCSL